MVFYTRKDGKFINADHRSQIDRANARICKKQTRKHRRLLDRKSIEENDVSLESYVKNPVSIYRLRYNLDKSRIRK